MNAKNNINNKIKSDNTTPNVFDVIGKNDYFLEGCTKVINDLEEWNSYLRSLHEQNSHLYLRELKIHEPPSDPFERRRKKKTIDPLPVTLEELNFDFKYGEYPLLPDRVIKERDSKNIQHYKRLQMNTNPDPTLEINQIKITEPNSFSAIPNPPSARRKNPRNNQIKNVLNDNNYLNNADQIYDNLNKKSPRNSNRINVKKVYSTNQNNNKSSQINNYDITEPNDQNIISKCEFPSLVHNDINKTYNIDKMNENKHNIYNNFDICNHDSSDSLASKKRKLRLQKKTIQTAQSSRRDRSISVPHKLHAMEYKTQPKSSRFPANQSITDHQATKLKIEKLEIRFQETMEKAVRHIQKLNRQMDKKYGKKPDDKYYYYFNYNFS